MTLEKSLTVPTADLRRVFEAVITHIEEHEGNAVILRDDYFWWIQRPEAYEMTAKPEPDAMTIGQLTEAWQSLIGSVEQDRVISHSAVWLSQILRAVGEEAAG
ncbi:hypothetical protein ABH923_003928 [Leifsonia sp. EB41]|uniref:hypothetical protein n=1 Tax=Leifsonia sp. EB41 TaxID=3156260 RepID=UPI003513C581